MQMNERKTIKVQTEHSESFLLKVRVLNYCILLFISVFMINWWAHASVTGTLNQDLTLREMSPDEDFLMLIEDLAQTQSKLPKGTVISFTQGNTLEPYAFEDDQSIGEVHELSQYPFQQNIRIDRLPGYSEKVRRKINTKRIFISEPQLMHIRIHSKEAPQVYHKCVSTLVAKVNKDVHLSVELKKNFPKILNETLLAQKKYGSQVRGDYISFIDYSVPSSHRRFFLINLSRCQYLTEFVAHGQGLNGTGGTKAMLKRCAMGALGASTRKNRTRDGIYKISGWHKTSKPWPIIGGSAYKALKLKSLDGKHTDVVARGVVMHEASYVFNRPQTQGRSSGCPAFAKRRLKNIAKRLQNSVLNVYAPQCR